MKQPGIGSGGVVSPQTAAQQVVEKLFPALLKAALVVGVGGGLGFR